MIQRKAKENQTTKTNRKAVKVMLIQTTTAKIIQSKYGRNYSKADDVLIKPNLMIDTTVSFEHIVEMTIPNSIYSEQGKKSPLMVPKCILLIFRISFLDHVWKEYLTPKLR